MVENKVFEIVKREFHVDEICREQNIREDFEADSIALLELMMALEEEFDIEVEDEKLDDIRTVGDVIDYIQSRV